MRLAGIDLFSPDTYVDEVPHAMFTRLRAEAPVYWHETPTGPRGFAAGGYWAITKHADIIALSRDPASFSSARAGTQLLDFNEEDMTAIQLMMLNMDPPQHVKYRNLVRHGFVPKMIHALEPRIRLRVREILDRIAWKGQCDLVTEVAAVLPLEVIAEMLGVPQEDRQKVFDWSNHLVGFDDPEYQTSMADGREAGMQMWMYALELAEQRAGGHGDDLVSVLLRAEVDGEQLTQMEMCSFFLLLAVAGNETTRNVISGGTLALMENPEQRDRLYANPSMVPWAVEEMLRWVTPVMYMMRTATRDFDLRGQRIRAGDRIAMYYSSANRDEEVFVGPDRFAITRQPNDHLAFGTGQHACLGATLARFELRIMFEELLRRLPDIHVAGPVRRLRSNFVNGWKEIQVAFTPERARAAAT